MNLRPVDLADASRAAKALRAHSRNGRPLMGEVELRTGPLTGASIDAGWLADVIDELVLLRKSPTTKAELAPDDQQTDWIERNSVAALSEGWRGRRYVACQAVADLQTVIAHLGVDNRKDPPPTVVTGAQTDNPITTTPPLPVPTAAQVNELKNLATVLLRSILAANDGQTSPAKLQSF